MNTKHSLNLFSKFLLLVSILIVYGIFSLPTQNGNAMENVHIVFLPLVVQNSSTQTDNIVENPSFEAGTWAWSFNTDASGQFDTNPPGYEGALAADISIGTQGENIQLYQSGLSLRPNTKYRLEFSARSNTEHDIAIHIHKHTSPYTNYGLSNYVVNLTTSWQTFVTEFTTTNFTTTIYDARLRFWFSPYADAGDQYYIDRVIIYPSDNTPPPPPPQTEGNVFYVSPNGDPDGDGSLEHPWDLQTALDHPQAVAPGDTIWLRGGTYSGQYVSHLKGATDRPITVRQYPGERATLDASGKMLIIEDSQWVNFWGFEVTSSNNARQIIDGPGWGDGIRINQGDASNHIKFINLIVHDVSAQGFGWWESNTDSEIYGTLVYYNGVNQFDHGIYTKNGDGQKRIVDSFIFSNAYFGIHAYGSPGDHLDNYHIEGNTIFNNGSIGYNTTTGEYGDFATNILVGGRDDLVANDPTLMDNYTYYPGNEGTAMNIGYRGGSQGATISNNYFMGGDLVMGGTYSNETIENNTSWVSDLDGFTQSDYPDNIWLAEKPTGTQIFVRPNQYEPGRANITIYNWDKLDSITLSTSRLSNVQIYPGDSYKLHNVQDFFGDVITGVYDGNSITIPMTGRSIAQPVGMDFTPPTTFPQFGAFVLIVTGR